MLTAEQRSRISIILVRARNPNNIGAVARAMHGFGFSDLRLVNDYSVPLERARSAIDASAILTGAREFATVADAVADCSLVVGTTAVGERKPEHPIHTLANGATVLRGAATISPVALLFGSEKTGLSNQALSHCHWLITIPMHPTPGLRHASMNLGQAAAVCLYELGGPRQDVPQGRANDPTQLAASAAELERITQLWGDLLAATGYALRRPAGAEPEEIRRTIYRLNLSQSDARRWLGILRQLRWKISPNG